MDVHAVELLRVVTALQRDMPSLTDSAETISEAAPPVRATAERVERVGERIPGLRSAP